MLVLNRAFNLFRKLDIFGVEVHLLAKGQSQHRTLLGAMMTLILYLILTYSCFSFILEMNKGKNANLNYKEQPLMKNEVKIKPYQGYNFNSSEFKFIVGVLNSAGQYIPNDNFRVYRVKFFFCSKSLNYTDCQAIPAKICGNHITEIIELLDVPKEYENIAYCMDEEFLEKQGSIRFQGSQRMDNYTFVASEISKCKNTTINQNCASEEEINSLLQNANLYYSYTFFQFNKEIDGYPYQKLQNLDVTACSPELRKYIKIHYQLSVTTSEYNPFYFYPQNTIYQALEFDSTAVDTQISSDRIFGQIELDLNVKKKLNYICFQTLMDVAAKIGGFLTILRALFNLLLYPFQVTIYQLHLVNCLINQQCKFSQIESSGKIFDRINLKDLIQSEAARSVFYSQLTVVYKLLDITEILSSPLKLTRQVETLQGSIKRFDPGKKQLAIKVELDEMIAVQQELQSRSPRSISQELKPVLKTNPFKRLQSK